MTMRQTNCSKCGHPVKWGKKGKRWYCYNLDGSDHWDECSKLLFAELKKHGKQFEHTVGEEYRKGYRRGETRKYYEKSGTWTKGKDYKPIDHKQNCDIPPWEVCDCGQQ